MAKRDKKIDKVTKGSERAGGAIEKVQKGNQEQRPEPLVVTRKRPKTSGDLANLILDAVYDCCNGNISVGQGNLVLNAAGKLIQIKKIEFQGSIKKHSAITPFSLPGT